MIKKGKKVVIGLTGRIDSAVAAYLLKKQGYDCIGVSIIFEQEDFHSKAIKYLNQRTEESGDKDFETQVGLTTEELVKKPLRGDCFIDDLKKIKEFSDWLGIPFYAAKGHDRFNDQIISNAFTARLGGQKYHPCFDCQKLKIEILIEKAKLLGADMVATGHYAKVYFSQIENSFSVLSSNDLDSDQSLLLTHLDQEHLEKLVLPLSEMRKAEVLKLYKKLDFDLQASKPNSKNLQPCFSESKGFSAYVESSVAPSLIKEGMIRDGVEDDIISEHLGLHHFYPGQSKLKTSLDRSIDPHFTLVEFSSQDGTITAYKDHFLTYSYQYVEDLKISEFRDVSRPLDAFIKTSSHSEFLPCRLIFKGNNCGLVEYYSNHKGFLPPGEEVCFYNKKGTAAKVIAGAKIVSGGAFFKSLLYPYRLEAEDDNGELQNDVREKLGPSLKY